MIKIFKNGFYLLKHIRFIPHYIVFNTHQDRLLLQKERDIWINVIKHESVFNTRNFFWLLYNLPEYRSVFYFRVGGISKLLRVFASGEQLLYLNLKSHQVMPGLVIQHGFSTIVEVVTIGENCQIWHNVTIGTNKSNTGNKPTIGNNVKICAGAMVLGKLSIGDNVTIGAGAVVVKDVPDNCVVVGNPASVVRLNDKRVNIPL